MFRRTRKLAKSARARHALRPSPSTAINSDGPSTARPPQPKKSLFRVVRDLVVLLVVVVLLSAALKAFVSDGSNHLVKRVIGLPGDHVVCCTVLGQLTINGVALAEPYLKPSPLPASRPFDTVVPVGSLRVLGDNRHGSADSSVHQSTTNGFVPLGNVVGRAFAITWPLTHWSDISNHPEGFAGVPQPQTAR